MNSKNQLAKVFNIAFSCIFYYILILAIGKMNLQSPLGALLLLPFWYLLYRVIRQEKMHVSNVDRTWMVLQGASTLIMLVMAYQLRVAVSWDWGQLLRTAYHYTMTGEIDNPAYFMRYPNNQFWLVCLTALFRAVFWCTSSVDFTVYKGVSMLVGILFVQAAIFLIYKTAGLLWDERKAFLAGLAALAYIPFYLYAWFLYSDTAKHILYTKQLRTWTNSCIAGDDYVSRKPIYENSLCQKIFSQNGAWHWICLLCAWLAHITVLTGLVLSAVFSRKKAVSEQKMLAGRIAVFGLFLFLSIWECNSRYLFTMIPVMILAAADGIFTAADRISNVKCTQEERR